MTPLTIEIILHYFCFPGDKKGLDYQAPAVLETFKFLVKERILFPDHSIDGGSYVITDRGRVFVKEGLCKVPLPVHCWEVLFPQKPTEE